VATRRRARRKSLTANITDIQRRLRYVESKPNPSRLTNQVVLAIPSEESEDVLYEFAIEKGLEGYLIKEKSINT
jgi:ATP-dependent DNA ligase